MNVTSRSPAPALAHTSGRQERRRSSQSGNIPGIDEVQSSSSAGPTARGIELNATISGTALNAPPVLKVGLRHWDRLTNLRLKDKIPREGCLFYARPTDRLAEVAA